MDRIIKFRAWNKEKKIMCYGREDNEQQFWDSVNCTDVEMVNTRLNSKFSEYEYMQYIGKEDKNKKEIYEGDIVKDEETNLFGVIKYSNNYLQFVVDDVQIGEQDYAIYMKDAEVIGNIYENPELLQNDCGKVRVMEKLKLCPCCKGKAELECGTDGARIRCTKCGITTEYYKDEHTAFARGGIGNLNDFHIDRKGSLGINQAIAVWNRRCCE